MIEALELRWRMGDQQYVLTLDADGVPHLDPPTAVDDRLDRRSSRSGGERPGPARRGQAWSDADEAALASSFRAGLPMEDIAAELGRSRGAVLARLVRLGLVEAEEAGLRYPVSRKGSEAPGESGG